jgi:hypothetical protein
MLRARMGIRAHPTLSYLLDLERVILLPSLAVAPGSPFVHLLIPSRRPRWGSCLTDRHLRFHFLLVVEGQVKPFPRSHPRSLAQSKRIGERGWRRGRAPIPLVNLSERILCGIGRDPWVVVAAARKHSPGDARELISERDRQQIGMCKTPGSLLDPRP